MTNYLRCSLLLTFAFNSLPAAAQQHDQQPPRDVKPAIPLSRETTYVLGPLDEHGYVDYVETIRQQLKEGVTPENNSAVPIIRAWGPAAIPDSVDPAEFWKELQIPPLPANGDYFVQDLDERIVAWLAAQFADPLSEEERFDLEMQALHIRLQATRRAWTSKQTPPLATWLVQNREHLDAVVKASRRERFYFPIVEFAKPEDGFFGAPVASLLPEVGMMRGFTQSIAIRAMLRSGEGRIDDAIEDIAAISRLAQISPGNLSLIHFLLAVAWEDIANHCQETVLSSESLTNRQLERLMSNRTEHRPDWNVVTALDHGERCFGLGMLAHYSRVGLPRDEQIIRLFSPNWLAREFEFDWAEVMRRSNEWSDRIVEIAKLETPNRIKQLQHLNDEVASHQQRMEELTAQDLAAMALVKRSQLLSDDMALTDSGFGMELVFKRDDYIKSRRALMSIAELLAEHRLRTGDYPDDLQALGEEMPLDQYTGGPFRYERRRDGYVLYSVGSNGKNDGGSDALKSILNGEYVDHELEPFDEHDDIVIRMPVPPLELPLLDNEKN